MALKELLKKLKAFDCAALNGSEVSHYYSTKLGYGYEEIVEDVMYDQKNNRIVLKCKDPEPCLWDNKTMVKYGEKKKK